MPVVSTSKLNIRNSRIEITNIIEYEHTFAKLTWHIILKGNIYVN